MLKVYPVSPVLLTFPGYGAPKFYETALAEYLDNEDSSDSEYSDNDARGRTRYREHRERDVPDIPDSPTHQIADRTARDERDEQVRFDVDDEVQFPSYAELIVHADDPTEILVSDDMILTVVDVPNTPDVSDVLNEPVIDIPVVFDEPKNPDVFIESPRHNKITSDIKEEVTNAQCAQLNVQPDLTEDTLSDEPQVSECCHSGTNAKKHTADAAPRTNNKMPAEEMTEETIQSMSVTKLKAHCAEIEFAYAGTKKHMVPLIWQFMQHQRSTRPRKKANRKITPVLVPVDGAADHPSATPDLPPSKAQLLDCRVSELRKIAKSLGIPYKGKKDTMVEDIWKTQCHR